MLPKTVNGFRIVCAEYKNLEGNYVILGHRPHTDGTHEYVTARMRSMDDSEWFWGHYFTGTTTALAEAVADFTERSQA